MKEKPVVGIATDGAHSAKERLTRFRAVDLSSGKELFSKAIGNWTNNIGEFLGIVEAVRYVMEHPESPRTIYSDSITAITWYRNKQTASSRRCPALQKAEIFLKVMEARIKDIEVLQTACGVRFLPTSETNNNINMAKLKSQSQKYVELKEEDYLLLIENTIKMEALKIAGIEKMPIYKAMEHILEHEHIDLLVKPVSRRYS